MLHWSHGIRFWRASKILFGVKNSNVKSSLLIKKSDFYSCAMICYEILTSKIFLENLKLNDYSVVIEGTVMHRKSLYLWQEMKYVFH